MDANSKNSGSGLSEDNLFEQLDQIAKQQPVFAGDLMHKQAKDEQLNFMQPNLHERKLEMLWNWHNHVIKTIKEYSYGEPKPKSLKN